MSLSPQKQQKTNLMIKIIWNLHLNLIKYKTEQ